MSESLNFLSKENSCFFNSFGQISSQIMDYPNNSGWTYHTLLKTSYFEKSKNQIETKKMQIQN